MLITAHVRAVSGNELTLITSLTALRPSRQTALFPTLLYYLKPCIYRASGLKPGFITLLRKEPDYSYYGGLQPPLYRSLPPGASLLLLPAGSGTFMFYYSLGRAESGAQRGGLFPQALPGEAGSIQHSRSQEDAKHRKAAGTRKQLRCFLHRS